MRSPILFCFLATLHSLSARMWTDDQNRKVEAEFVRKEGTNVVLRLPAGKEIPFPVAKLSEADRAFLATMDAPPSGGGAGLNFDAPWPDRVSLDADPEVTTISESAEEKTFIYESANYRYTCDVRLAQSVVRGFAQLFEATNRYCAALPLAMASGKPAEGKHQIKLFEKKEDYVKDGGPPQSAGVFIGSRQCVLIPLESLGVRPVGSSYMLDREKTNKTVPHELTHQLTPPAYFDEGNGWFTEGIAEYVGVTGYRAGSFNVRNNRRDFAAYVTGYGKKDDGGRALGKEIKVGPLKAFMNQSYANFTGNPQMNYGCGLLITSYFCHMDGTGDGARLKAYLKAMRAGKKGDDALAVLLDGRSYADLEKEIAKAWSRAGVDLLFNTASIGQEKGR